MVLAMYSNADNVAVAKYTKIIIGNSNNQGSYTIKLITSLLHLTYFPTKNTAITAKENELPIKMSLCWEKLMWFF